MAAEDAQQDLDREQAGVPLGDPPQVLGLHAIDRGALRQRRGDPPQCAAQWNERPQQLRVLGGNRGDVYRAGDDAAGQCGDHLLGCLVAGPVGRLGGRGAQVGRDDHVWIAEQGMLGHGLGAEHI